MSQICVFTTSRPTVFSVAIFFVLKCLCITFRIKLTMSLGMLIYIKWHIERNAAGKIIHIIQTLQTMYSKVALLLSDFPIVLKL
jgi:hypothetical protein